MRTFAKIIAQINEIMGYIEFIKAFLIGLTHAGGFYMLVALGMHYFPWPLLYSLKHFSGRWIEKRGLRLRLWLFRLRYALSRLLMVLIWSALALGYVFTLSALLQTYINLPETPQEAWPHYLSALALPAAFILYYLARWVSGRFPKDYIA